MILEPLSSFSKSEQEMVPWKDFPTLNHQIILDFEAEHNLILPEDLKLILLGQNGGFIRDKYIKSISELNGISLDPNQWETAILPLPRWVEFKHEIYESFPTLEELESINGEISRLFVISGDGTVFYLLDYRDSTACKAVLYLDLVGGTQELIEVGKDLSVLIKLP